MPTGKGDKTDAEQLLSILNLAEKFIVRVQTSTTDNYSIAITAAKSNEEDDRPDPLRVPELLIVACVLLLWCASIFIFIRHSELLRIRHRDLPFRSAIKVPMNLNTITVVDRTSDMVIHPKRRQSSISFMPQVYNQLSDDENDGNMSRSTSFSKGPRYTRSFDFNPSGMSRNHADENNDFLLDPYQIPSSVRRSLLDLHRKSSVHCAANPMLAYYSTVDISRRKSNDDDDTMTVEKRYIRESPL